MRRRLRKHPLNDRPNVKKTDTIKDRDSPSKEIVSDTKPEPKKEP